MIFELNFIKYRQNLGKIENFSNAPPPIALINSKNPKLFVPKDSLSIPGTTIVVPNLKINKTTKVNNILFLKSLFLGLNSCLNLANN